MNPIYNQVSIKTTAEHRNTIIANTLNVLEKLNHAHAVEFRIAVKNKTKDQAEKIISKYVHIY